MRPRALFVPHNGATSLPPPCADGAQSGPGHNELVGLSSVGTIRPMTRGARPCAALLLTAMLAVSACTAAPAPVPTLPPVTSIPVAPVTAEPSTTAPSPSAPVTAPSTLGTVTATAIPTSAPSGDDSESAAISTAEAFLGASTLARVQQDPSPVRRLALATCDCLTTLIADIKDQKDRKLRFESDPFAPATLAVTKHTGSMVTVRVKFIVPGFRFVDAHRKVVSSYPAEPLAADLPMQYVGGSWKIVEYQEAS